VLEAHEINKVTFVTVYCRFVTVYCSYSRQLSLQSGLCWGNPSARNMSWE